MIDDPIQWNNDSEHPAGRYFGKSSYALFYLDILEGPATRTVSVLFQIGLKDIFNQGPKTYTFGKVPWIPREEFYDKLMAQYPEHYEWLLWNPEWL